MALFAHPAFVLSAPVVYSLIVPLAPLDAWITLYQQPCFRVSGDAAAYPAGLKERRRNLRDEVGGR